MGLGVVAFMKASWQNPTSSIKLWVMLYIISHILPGKVNHSTWKTCTSDLKTEKNRIAVSFFHLVSRAALIENCTRLNFCVLESNQPAAKLFQSLGAVDLTLKEGWHYYRIPRLGIEELAKPTIISTFNSQI